MTSPYDNLKNPETAFWRSAVAEKGILGIDGIYRKKFDIFVGDNIATAGSCFAQHIGNRLIRGGFSFLDVEPPPPSLPKENWQNNGYGIYSARYGNIYTARQLLQLVKRAKGDYEPIDGEWRTDSGAFVDAFRPTLDSVGFQDLDELRHARRYHLRSVLSLIEKADVLVFTLGLTESWISRRDGAVYPICPGTAGGSFDDERYRFHNFTASEVMQDMREAISLLREVNPSLRFVLTVSPVPLVATASGDHVLAATTYSKSVLRAVAGELYMTDPLIDYFPSYELATATISRGVLFQPNMRSVTPDGVDFILSKFISEHQPQTTHTREAETKTPSPVITKHDDDVVCDEILLEKFAG